MSYAAFKVMVWPTRIDNCASGFITHSGVGSAPLIQSDDIESEWQQPNGGVVPIPNLIVTFANILEVYIVRGPEEENSKGTKSSSQLEPKRGVFLAGLSGASVELVFRHKFQSNVESMAVLSMGGGYNSKRRDAIILTFPDAKISVLEFDDSIDGLRTSSTHSFEGPEWQYLKRGQESCARGPLVKVDPQGCCSGVLAFGLELIILKAAQGGDVDVSGFGGTVSALLETSYVISLRELEMKHVKDFVFLHGYIEPVMVILHEQDLTSTGRVSSERHSCMISALSINTTLKQNPLIWSAINLPHDAYKLLAVPSPVGGVLVISANAINYHSQSASCALGLNRLAVPADMSQELPRSSFSVELDAANATWLVHNVAMLSTKAGELLLLTLVFDGRVVQRLELSKYRASVLTSGTATFGSSFFFLGSVLGDGMLVQYTRGVGTAASTSDHEKEEC